MIGLGSQLTLSSPPLAAARPTHERGLHQACGQICSLASVQDRLRTALWEVQTQSMAEACQQKQYYDRKIGTVKLKPGNLILVKADAFKGKRKIKDRWEEETWVVVHQIATDIPPYEVTNQHRRS